jgi:hypothetical protein
MNLAGQEAGASRSAKEQPVINSSFLRKRHVLPIAICCAGVALAWLAKKPSGLLAGVTGKSTFGGRRGTLLSTAATVMDGHEVRSEHGGIKVGI